MIRVLIDRHIADTLESVYELNSRTLLQHAVATRGFISGETLVDSQDPNHRLTLCNWRSTADWDKWYHSEERKELMNELVPIMDQDEKIIILEQH
ncbi:MAG: antibiotic biosynthesis monooxygenase [Alteromonadaceae bacterium]|uniref:antibiotic biosynthesis monooxygenase family protein n=1 Tax=unclassified Marinobacter TaxID=83889 RepID=UPI000C371C63|nr:antibiotic biosynthesis monooxygenase [Marinobacter sp. BGYM27]MAA63300.1 antibiotic biosynthesis monooxygenase [Alteromonadaceae bacterium]MBH85580.1 antibiotic biosynthesis monooxygenase [Alteromonadaceae bacterium]MDG5500530.1 antibiotic biosynthesis monooxygenase [Marinobacter sp. BGYM27]|tara:strand:+ start:89 stop:373 length:285 start_codon:yes stop_codon:yes gene_type:complete